MKRPILLFFTSLAILATCCHFAFAAPLLRIGIVAPLTGSKSSTGASVRNSIELASRKYDPGHKVQFLFEDDQFLPKHTVAAVHKLINEDKVDALAIYGSHTALAVNSIAEIAKRPMIAFSIVERVVEGKRYVMKHWVPARVENALLSKEVQRRRYRTVAIVTMQNDAMFDLRKLFVDSKLATITVDEEFAPDNIDFRATCSKIKAANPDAVYVLLWAPQPGIFAKQLRTSGYRGALFGAHNLEDLNEVKVADGALSDAWFVTVQDRTAENYYTDYHESFHSHPTAGGVNAYDVAKMFIDGAEVEDLNIYLHGLKDFEGVLGRYSATPFNDFDIQAMLKRISGDRIEALDSKE